MNPTPRTDALAHALQMIDVELQTAPEPRPGDMLVVNRTALEVVLSAARPATPDQLAACRMVNAQIHRVLKDLIDDISGKALHDMVDQRTFDYAAAIYNMASEPQALDIIAKARLVIKAWEDGGPTSDEAIQSAVDSLAAALPPEA